MGEVKVLPVPDNSIIWLHDVSVGGDPAMVEQLMGALNKAIGHDRFVILVTEGDGVVEVLGPDEMVERVRAALDA